MGDAEPGPDYDPYRSALRTRPKEKLTSDIAAADPAAPALGHWLLPVAICQFPIAASNRATLTRRRQQRAAGTASERRFRNLSYPYVIKVK